MARGELSGRAARDGAPMGIKVGDTIDIDAYPRLAPRSPRRSLHYLHYNS